MNRTFLRCNFFLKRCDNVGCRAFTIIETVIVLGVVGIIFAGIWSAAIMARHKASLQQANMFKDLLVDNVRNAYASHIGINGGISVVVPYLDQMNAMPVTAVINNPTSCAGVAARYANGPFAGATDPCGTLRACAWDMSSSSACDTATSPSSTKQSFAIEFSGLSQPDCINLAPSISAYAPVGLVDIFINQKSVKTNQGNLPVSGQTAMNTLIGCQTGTTNVIDAVYTIKPVEYSGMP